MTWNGGGTFDRIHNFSADASAGIQAQAARFDAEHDNVKGGLEAVVARNGENAATANLPMGGFKHTGVAAAAAATEYLRADQQVTIYVSNATNGSNNQSASATIFPTSLQAGQQVVCENKFSFASTSANQRQLIINGLSAPVFDWDGKVPLNLDTGDYAEFIYGSAEGGWVAKRPMTYDAEVNITVGLSNVAGGITAATSTGNAWLHVDGDQATLIYAPTAPIFSMSASASTGRIFIEGLPVHLFNRAIVDRDLGFFSYALDSSNKPAHAIYDAGLNQILVAPRSAGVAASTNVVEMSGFCLSFYCGDGGGNY